MSSNSHSLEYQRYISDRSPAWMNIRAKVMARAHGWCERCHRRACEHVHHLTYVRLGRELMEDLIALCPTCHVLMHGGNKVLAVVDCGRPSRHRRRVQIMQGQLPLPFGDPD